MDLIAQIIAAALSFIAGIIGNVLAHDVCQSADAVCIKIIRAAAHRLAKADQTLAEQEWIAALYEYETVFQKYRHAVGCYLAASEMKRFSRKAPPPLINGAPGLVWKLRKNKVWEGRWQAPLHALREGYMVKSVKLIMLKGNTVSIEDEAFLVQVSSELQAGVDEWLGEQGTI